jgi:hypothetical protein
MDRRTTDAKTVSKMGLDSMRESASRGLDIVRWEYGRAERCRICGLESEHLPHAFEVNCIIDRELMRNATYKEVLEAVEPLVAEWPAEKRPTYSAVRNHAKQHLRRDEAFVRELLEQHAREDGIDVDDGQGSILTPKGLLAFVMEKGFEEMQKYQMTPTVSETISASKALAAMEAERLRTERDEAQAQVRVMTRLLHQAAPATLDAAQVSALPARAQGEVVVLPENEAVDAALVPSRAGGVSCDKCGRTFGTDRGMDQHARRAHQ